MIETSFFTSFVGVIFGVSSNEVNSLCYLFSFFHLNISNSIITMDNTIIIVTSILRICWEKGYYSGRNLMKTLFGTPVLFIRGFMFTFSNMNYSTCLVDTFVSFDTLEICIFVSFLFKGSSLVVFIGFSIYFFFCYCFDGNFVLGIYLFIYFCWSTIVPSSFMANLNIPDLPYTFLRWFSE